jgi:Ion channel
VLLCASLSTTWRTAERQAQLTTLRFEPVESRMSASIVIFSLVAILLVLQDAFETMLLPRRISRQFRFARFFFQVSWRFWAAVARRIRSTKRRNAFLSQFGPLSFLVLMSLWASGLIAGFACLHWALGTSLRPPDETQGLSVYLYMSGVIFFTLGFGDVTPADPLGRFLAVLETGLGFAFLAVVISYLPILYQAFSHREVTISLLDARAGSPPSAGQLLMRFARYRKFGSFDRFLEEWERWAGEVLESHVSFPLLSFYRSQHDNQSWLAAMTVILDASALVIASVKENDSYQAQLTFAMARHAVVDLAQVYHIRPLEPAQDRMPSDELRQLRVELRNAGADLREGESADRKLVELRRMYEPFVNGLSEFFILALPPVVPASVPVDNWQTSAWMRRTSGIGNLVPVDSSDDHVD